MRTATCLDHLAPYLFAQIDEKRDALAARGVDVISLGIGDPDTPTPTHIVDAMAEAIRAQELRVRFVTPSYYEKE